MTILTWRKEPPDSEGVWACSEDGVNIAGVMLYQRGVGWSGYQYCRIGDMPVIKEATKYRTPTAADVGEQCEFSDDERNWRKRELAAVLKHDVPYKFLSYTAEKNGTYSWNYARIVDDGKTREPRELFVNEYSSGLSANYFFDLESARSVRGDLGIGTVRFREVIE